jgi:hypothetical protein
MTTSKETDIVKIISKFYEDFYVAIQTQREAVKSELQPELDRRFKELLLSRRL